MKKVVMIRFRTDAPLRFFGLLAVLPLAISSVAAGEFGADHPVVQIPSTPIADHCAQYGQGFVDVGNGVCGRMSGRTRVYVGAANGNLNNPWVSNGTANAAMRSDNMVPGASVTHLRVRGGLDSPTPFR